MPRLARSLFLGGLVNQFLLEKVPLFSTLVARHRLGPQLFANGVDAGPIGPGAMHGPEAPPTSGIAQVFGFIDGSCKNTLPFDIDDALAVGWTITIVGAA